MKHFMAFIDDDDDMLVDDTPPNSLGDNSPPPPPPLSNLPPSLPPPSHCPPRTPSSLPYSPEYDVAKGGGGLEMSETGRAEADLQKEIVIANIPYVVTKIDQPIPDTGNQSETDDYKGFLDVGFMPPANVPVVHFKLAYRDS
ncbi:unnamed protein product [Lactuca saligna]|uniref:Uncharacterized protein n=1 Tax=Lactuca saligna TaxID=75948 RepID=A0AA35VU57_LACSI|nr:unnamed protein product [Lactuca saligna]